ncbi:epidermis-specific secreted glycoprotein EP1-like protein [Tanacetum coccineum]
MSSSYSFLIISICFQFLFIISQAIVPASETFTYVNQGEFAGYIVEYDGDYRSVGQFSNPFSLCFYNTTPNAFTLALRMGTVRSELRMYWVWEANRGKPVKENATLSLGTDGNLVLAEADGQVVWQTNTANKGVVGIELLPNGNMVLTRRRLLHMQSFDSPTIRAGGSRSAGNGVDQGKVSVSYQNAWKFGLCEDNQCVACPTPNGLSGWSKDCDVKTVTSCKASDFHYYKLEGVDHFTIKYTRGDETNQSNVRAISRMQVQGILSHDDRGGAYI